MALYKYKDISFDKIFSTTDTDATNNIITVFKVYGTSLIFNSANGTVSKQNNINYITSPVNYFSNLSAFYTDYLYQAEDYTISVDTKCTQLRVLLCGAGGSGGAGAGDEKGERGWSGSGGGGGAYSYTSLSVTGPTTFKLSIGAGGLGVNGSGGGDYGADGKNGEDTIFYRSNYTTVASVDGGSGGNGGNPDSLVFGGAGATTGTINLISDGNSGSVSTSYRSETDIFVSAGGTSGWVKFKGGNSVYPSYTSTYTNSYFGNGGAGTQGERNPQTATSGAGHNGWARIYFIY